MASWLLLIHQLPPKPDYVRVKIGRRLQRIGAVALKNTVYVLPDTDAALEDLEWTAREIRDRGGEANVCRASFIEGVTDGELQQRFNSARDAEYEPLLAEAQNLQRTLRRTAKSRRGDVAEAASQLRKRTDTVRSVDYFGAAKGQALEGAFAEIDRALHPEKLRASRRSAGEFNGRIWVTRAGIHVDRMASAWLIRRFIDPKASFRFVAGNAYKPRKNELRFDMFDAEFTHEGDRCTFEVFLERMALADRALQAIGEVVHDIDLRDDKFGRPETAGVGMLVNGIALAHHDDDERLRRATEVFDELYRTYGRGSTQKLKTT